MTAKEARAITDSKDTTLNDIFKEVKSSAKTGNCEIEYSINTIDRSYSDILKEKLQKLGYKVTRYICLEPKRTTFTISW